MSEEERTLDTMSGPLTVDDVVTISQGTARVICDLLGQDANDVVEIVLTPGSARVTRVVRRVR
jgi:hypothetical protein